MTDNEIKKALECCVESECEGCKYEYDTACKEYILHDCIRLIKQKQDEVKAYKHYYDECLKDLKKANAEIDRLKYANQTNISSIATLHEELKTAKAEAYKEFADRLKDESEHFELEKENFVSEEQIDNLVKEMVGE